MEKIRGDDVKEKPWDIKDGGHINRADKKAFEFWSMFHTVFLNVVVQEQ